MVESRLPTAIMPQLHAAHASAWVQNKNEPWPNGRSNHYLFEYEPWLLLLLSLKPAGRSEVLNHL